jgi:hypothetical protein
MTADRWLREVRADAERVLTCADLDWRDARQHSVNDVAPDRLREVTTSAAPADLRTGATCQAPGTGGTPAGAAAVAAGGR